jgi:cystathionine beta-lyase/cystathionine gamma-synthase
MSDPLSPRDALGPTTPLVPPLFQSSVYTFPDLDALESVMSAQAPGFIYARDGHPNAQHLAGLLAALESATWAVICSSGMAAISAIVLATVGQGGRIVASNRLYGRTSQLLLEELPRFGVQATLVDINDLDSVKKALSASARTLFVETMSNPLLGIADVPALAELARAHNCRLVVDNTFATPVLLRPLDLGADLVMESLTKMIGGHSDVTLGLVCGKGDLLPEMARIVSIWGLASNPFDCWLTERGLATLPLRIRAASTNAAALADWLATQPAVSRVVYPGRTDHPNHAVAARLLGNTFGNMLCFELSGGRDAVNRFMQKARGVPFSPSLGNTTTTCSHPATTSHRYVSPAERRRQGISDGLVRLSVGIEDLAVIQAEMAKGL